MEEYVYVLKFRPDEPNKPSGEYLKFEGHCEVLEGMELKPSKDTKRNFHLITLPHPLP